MIQLNLNIHSDRVIAKITNDLAIMKSILEISSTNHLFNRPFQIRGSAIELSLPAPEENWMKHRATQSCFKSIMSALQDYMDELIAIMELSINPVNSENEINSKEELFEFFNKKYFEKLLKVSSDRTLNVPKKLKLIFKSPENNSSLECAKSLFDLRNGLEHHKELANIDRKLKYKRLALITSDNKEIREFPVLVQGTKDLLITTIEETVNFDEGSQILLSSEQIYDIVFCIVAFMIEPMKNEVTKFINEIANEKKD